MSPYCASRSVTGTPRLAANQLSIRWDCAVTSGPMPSPPTTATLTILERLLMLISSQNGSMAAQRGRLPERREFHDRAAASMRPRRAPPAGLRGGADQFRTDAACPLAK